MDSNVEESDRVEVERFQQQDKLNYQLSTKKTELLIINQKLNYHLSTKNLNYQLSTKKNELSVINQKELNHQLSTKTGNTRCPKKLWFPPPSLEPALAMN